MFGNKKQSQKITVARQDDEGTRLPAGISDAAQVYYAAFHSHEATLNAYRKERLAMLLAIIGLVVAIAMMMPLRKTEVRVLEVESATGRTVVSNRTPSDVLQVSERVGKKMQEYFLREFVVALTTIDARTIKERIPFAASMLAGKRAENAFEEFVYKIEKVPEKIAQNPGLTREYQHKSVAMSADGKIAFVRFNRVEKINGTEQLTTPMLVTLEFVFLPEEPGKEKDLNPLGGRVLYFTVATDL
jgi:type IV secretory pathway component VirB8